MLLSRAVLSLACVGLLAGCSSGGSSPQESTETADIGKVTSLKSSFGPEFKVEDFPPKGIDPKELAAQTLPPNITFDPPDCEKFAAGSLPDDLKGNMAAVSAEGAGNRFVAIALETSKPLPITDPGPDCQKVSFAGGPLHGTVEVIPAPEVEGVHTRAVHRVLQTTINGKPQTGEVFSYTADFGDYRVIVTANPLVETGKPPVPVDTKRAEELLTSAVTAVRS
ncbi:DUF5642 family protein [Mycolicibacterium palauense]|uniref:DUF5642 family protein n=1 Tax=Mycolicibacterium palauense TaxID=2034511 RepID=UPI000BFF19E7|nr:DUF5642 family protein [Mycolicibacterium palauense]